MVSAMQVPILLLTSALLADHAATFDSATQTQIDDVVQAGLQCRKNPGLALSVVKNGEVLVSKGYGVTDLNSQQPVTADTQFQIASLTKAFTAALLVTVLEENDMSVSTNVRKVSGLPSNFAFNNTLRTVYATLEDLLAHRTGIARNNFMRLSTDHGRETLPSKLKYLPSAGGFRDSFYYNDLLFALSAYCTQLIAGSPWEDLVREKIFTPLNMSKSTFISDVDLSRSDVATPYVVEHGRILEASLDFVRHWGKNIGSGNIFSTANDMTKWMRMLLNGGQDTSGARILQQSVLDAVFKPSNTLPTSTYTYQYRRPTFPASFGGDSYGLGWRLGYYRGNRMYYHSGSTFGYVAYLTLLPDMNIGVFTVMTSEDSNYKFRLPLHMYLLDQALGETPFIDTNTICTFPDPWESDARRRRSLDLNPLAQISPFNPMEPSPRLSGELHASKRANQLLRNGNVVGEFLRRRREADDVTGKQMRLKHNDDSDLYRRRRRAADDDARRMKLRNDDEPDVYVRRRSANDATRSKKLTGWSRRARAATSIPLASYEGLFRHQAYGDLTVRVNSSCSCLQLDYGIGQWHLEARHEPSFVGRWTKGAPIIDSDFDFLVDGQEVVGVQAPDFEDTPVPVFYRQGSPGLIG